MGVVRLLFVVLSALLASTSGIKFEKEEWTAAKESSLSFLVFGDWGGIPVWPYITVAEEEVAKQMGKTAGEIESKFTLALGDNFYTTGVKDVDDPRFKTTFEDVFTAQSLMTRWYVIAGNHDHYGNVSAEIAYTKKSNRWYFPSLYYTEVIPVGTSDSTVQFVFIDTVTLAGLTHPTKRYLAPSPVEDPVASEEQWQWINRTLASSTATWLYVAGHFPVWSVAEHGPTSILVSRLRPMLEKYGATAYLNGHDHDLQHIRPDNQTVDYFTTGAGHISDPSTAHMDDIPKGSLKYRYGPTDFVAGKGGYTSISLTPTSATTIFYNYKGDKLYTTVNNAPRKMESSNNLDREEQ